LAERKAELLAIKRKPRNKIGAKHPKQEVQFADVRQAAEQIKGLEIEILLVVPIANLRSGLTTDLDRLRSN
jgi:hypothetical protein